MGNVGTLAAQWRSGKGNRVVSLAAAFLMLAATTTLTTVPAGASALAPPVSQDPFYQYTGTQAQLNAMTPGTVLGARNFQVTFKNTADNTSESANVVQLLYRSTAANGTDPTVNVTSVLTKADQALQPHPKVISYQSAYDSLNPSDEPSNVLHYLSLNPGVPFPGDPIFSGSPTFIGELGEELASVLNSGFTVVVPDTEGQHADFGAGPEYGYNTLDSLRAALSSPNTGLSGKTQQIGLSGYSGGSIGTEWAAELAPTYAPDVNHLLVGATFGGVLVDPDHNVAYLDGSASEGVTPMAVIGISRAYNLDLTAYLSNYGKQIIGNDKAGDGGKFQQEDISQLSVDPSTGQPYTDPSQYLLAGVHWSGTAVSHCGDAVPPAGTAGCLFLPQYPHLESIPVLVNVVNKLIMGNQLIPGTSSYYTPTIPLDIAQGNVGDGNPGTGQYGAGDGVMVTGDVRSLASEYCSAASPSDTTSTTRTTPALCKVGWRKGFHGLPRGSSARRLRTVAPIPW